MPILENIERIEVIRGPGATIWGANAVLGVINIITRKRRDTKGTRVTAGGGNSDRAFGNVSSGGTIGAATYRGYFGGSDEGALRQASGASAGDGWSSLQGGFRLDGSRDKSTWMLEGDMFRASETETAVYLSIPAQGVIQEAAQFQSFAGNLTGEWRRRVGETGEVRVQAYFDYVDRPEPQATRVAAATWDTEFQYDVRKARIHNLSVGAGERLISAKIDMAQGLAFSPAGSTYSNANTFLQDEVHFFQDSVVVTAGAKLEHNHFGGWGTEPSANAIWMPSKRQSLWISAARSLRTPTQFDRSVQLPFSVYPASLETNSLPILVQANGSPTFGPESVRDFEGGYRTQVSKAFSVDVTGFYDQDSNLRSWIAPAPVFVNGPIPYLQITEIEGNGARAVGKGGEAAVALEVSRTWKLEGSYTYL